MLWIALGQWNLAAGRRFTRRRIYFKGYWTPFVKLHTRNCKDKEQVNA
jgi:hypothetical protein